MHRKRVRSLLPESQGQDLALSVLCAKFTRQGLGNKHRNPGFGQHGRCPPYRGTSLERKRLPLGPYSRPMPGALRKSYGRGVISKVPLHGTECRFRCLLRKARVALHGAYSKYSRPSGLRRASSVLYISTQSVLLLQEYLAHKKMPTPLGPQA